MTAEAFYTLKASDVGRATVRAFNRRWRVGDFLGRVLPGDVGKRVYLRGDIVQVENEEQRAKREAKGAA